MHIRTLSFSTSLLFLLIFSACTKPASQDASTTSGPAVQNNETPVAQIRRIPQSSFQGKTYDDIRELPGFEYADGISGIVISSNLERIHSLAFYRKDEKLLIALERVLDPDAEALRFEALDMIELSDIQENWLVLHDDCFQEDQATKGIFAICAVDDEAEFLTRVHKAWKANLDQGTIAEIDPDHVRCLNPRYED